MKSELCNAVPIDDRIPALFAPYGVSREVVEKVSGMMRFENYYGENDCSGCCPECMLTTESHCAHCAQFRRAGGVHIPEGYDYSHLIASPAKQDDKVFDTARFDVLLTEYDRILLGFGMRITWQV